MSQNVKCRREAKYNTTLKMLLLIKDIKVMDVFSKDVQQCQRCHESKSRQSVGGRSWSLTRIGDVLHRDCFGYILNSNKVYGFTWWQERTSSKLK